MCTFLFFKAHDDPEQTRVKDVTKRYNSTRSRANINFMSLVNSAHMFSLSQGFSKISTPQNSMCKYKTRNFICLLFGHLVHDKCFHCTHTAAVHAQKTWIKLGKKHHLRAIQSRSRHYLLQEKVYWRERETFCYTFTHTQACKFLFSIGSLFAWFKVLFTAYKLRFQKSNSH